MDALINPDEIVDIKISEELISMYGVVGIAPTQSVIQNVKTVI